MLTMQISSWIWILLLATFFLYPAFKQNLQKRRRLLVLRDLEKKRGSRVIALIQRQRLPSFLGLILGKFIDIEDSEEILNAIRHTNKDTPIDLILHTPGGLVIAAQQIAHALARHSAKITVFVPHYALSGGTYLALAADEIAMDKNALLGQVDPQVSGLPAVSLVTVEDKKDPKDIDDKFLILSDISKKAIRQIREAIYELLQKNGYKEKEAKKISQELTSSKYTHDHPINYENAKAIGLHVTEKMPNEVYQLLRLYGYGQGEGTVLYSPKDEEYP